MKVTRNTPNQLILSYTPWMLGGMLVVFILAFVAAGLFLVAEENDSILFGLGFALFGGGMGFAGFCVFVRRVQVILDRARNSLIIRRQSVFGYQAVQHRLSDLSHAELESSISDDDDGSTMLYRPVLVLDKGMSAGRHPIVHAFSNGHGSARLVDAVNGWLQINDDARTQTTA